MMKHVSRQTVFLLFSLTLLAADLTFAQAGDRGAQRNSSRRHSGENSNLVENGDFSRSTRGWFNTKGNPVPIKPGSGLMRIEPRGGRDRDPCLRLDARNQSGRVRVGCTIFRLPAGRRYRLEFWARSLDDREVLVGAVIPWIFGRVPRGEFPRNKILVRDGEWARYGYDFVVPEEVSRARVAFLVPLGRGAMFDDVSVTELVDHLEVRTFAPSSAVLQRGEAAQLTCTLVNSGGTVISSLKGHLGIEGAEREVAIGDLAPGEVREVAVDLPELEAGVYPARLRFEGRLGAPVTDSTNVVVYDPREAGEVSLDSGAARLLFHRLPGGHGVVEILHREEESWRTVGVMPGLGRLRLATDSIDGVLVGEVKEDGERLVGRAEHHGMVFDFSWEGAGDGWFDVRVEARARRSVDLAALVFPEVHAGWGAAGGVKDSAVFGGLELLSSDQYSSGAEATDPELAGRYVPHPLEVTIPLMSVVEGGVAIGLAWDPLLRWDRWRTLPSSLFASPNRWMGQDDHLMALFLPSIPEFVDAGHDRASRPFSLFRGQRITLEAELFVLPVEGGAEDTLDHWYRRHGAPPPAKRFTRWKDAAKSCAAAMLSRWDERAAAWPHRGDDEAGFQSVVATTLLLFGLHEGGSLGRRVLAQVDESIHRVVTGGGSKRLGLDLALHVGHVPENLERLHGSLGVLRRQGEDGSFGYEVGPGSSNDEKLGDIGHVALGVSFDRLEMLLKYAAVSGNPAAYRGVLKGLAFTEKLTVPSGAQTWEVPILAPDLLAAQQGIDLQLAAFELTGSDRHLEEAKRWARCGLAFISTFEIPERPAQLYASTAVFGAGWFTFTWWGRPVQWVGVVYAGALLRLAPHDPDFPWGRVAEGLLASCLQQQALAAERAPWPGCYADYYALYDGALEGVWLAPWTILREMNQLAGIRASSTRRLGGGIGRALTSAAEIEKLEELDGTVTARLRYPSGRTCYSVFGPMGLPTGVFIGRRELERAQDLEEVDDGWFYDEDKGLAVIEHSFAGRPLILRITGVSSRRGGRR
jgi:hypothetical protein